MLLRKLNKDRIIKNNDEAKEAFKDELDTPAVQAIPVQDSLSSLLENRLCSSKVLAKEVGDSIARLRKILSPNDEIEQAIAEDGKTEGEVEPEVKEDEGWESGFVTGLPSSPVANIKRKKGARIVSANAVHLPRDVEDMDVDDQGVGDDNSSSASESGFTSITEDNSPSANAASSFLPSLAIGFKEGGSNASEWSDDDALDEDNLDITPRKNRRGQRARKAIWEKKYGKNANHLKQQGMDNGGRPPVKHYLAKGQKHAPKSVRGIGSSSRTSYATVSKQNSSKSIGKGNAKKEDVPLHPSWEAAKRRKSQPMILPASGKKIVF
ncbi:hypothetical protein FRC19_000489 [Serendipita sp. 401]|nr:hypothetical protein FRC16_000042 [Serendipita sp. 398]KAG8825052.1 hypothetical protein FRC19_000489 [Serendipita sp. 401]KAG8879455.1 hypothetical protein FRC20_000027 [Serendipita sp. 405]